MSWQYLLTGNPVPPETFTCFECNEPVEILGRFDQ
jgi:hypothetical protein